jgi:hypothetical protein
MKKIALIACVKKKLGRPARARDLYISPLFKKNLAYAHVLKPDKIFILSAKYYLLPLDKTISPYNLTLNKMSTKEIKVWAKKVIDELKKVADLNNDAFIFLVGENYREFLVPKIRNYKIPMKGLGIGKQLKFLTDRLR